MQRVFMCKLLLGILLILSVHSFGQDPSTIKKEIDSTLLIRFKVTQEKFKSDFDSVRYRVFYKKATNELVTIEEIHYPVLGGKTKWWIYRYHFRDDRVLMISKYNNVKMKDARRENAYYYFRNNSMVYKEETGTSIININNELIKAIKLRSKFSKK